MKLEIVINDEGFHTIFLIQKNGELKERFSYKNQEMKTALESALKLMLDNKIANIEVLDKGKNFLKTATRATLTLKQFRLFAQSRL